MLCVSQFPQPDDRGTVGGHAVLRVLRRGSQAVHYVSQPLEEGSEVCLEVDWRRRFDHMQQHSGKLAVDKVSQAITSCDPSPFFKAAVLLIPFLLEPVCQLCVFLCAGQHLITAVADKLYGVKTTSW